MTDQPHENTEEGARRCGANKTDGSGNKCRNYAGKGTSHTGWGQCEVHGGNTPSGIKFAERLMVLENIEKYEGPGGTDDPREALIGEIRRASGLVSWLDIVIKDLDPGHEYVKKHERERGHLARACKMALDAGIDERMVKLAESQMRQMAEIMRRVFGDERLQLTPEQRQLVPGIVREHLQLVA